MDKLVFDKKARRVEAIKALHSRDDWEAWVEENKTDGVALQAVADKAAEILADEKKVLDVKYARDTMNAAIFTEMYSVFKTDDPMSANAFAQSWQLKVDNPSEYSGLGIVADETLGGFTAGDSLDTDQKVTDYYNLKLDKLIAFDKLRDTKIAEYLAAKALIEA